MALLPEQLSVTPLDNVQPQQMAEGNPEVSSTQSRARSLLQKMGILAVAGTLMACSGEGEDASSKVMQQEQHENAEWPPKVPVVEWSQSIDFRITSISLDDYTGNNKEQIAFTLISQNDPDDQLQMVSDPSIQYQTLQGTFQNPTQFFDIKADAQLPMNDGQMASEDRPINRSNQPGTLFGRDTNKLPEQEE